MAQIPRKVNDRSTKIVCIASPKKSIKNVEIYFGKNNKLTALDSVGCYHTVSDLLFQFQDLDS